MSRYIASGPLLSYGDGAFDTMRSTGVVILSELFRLRFVARFTHACEYSFQKSFVVSPVAARPVFGLDVEVPAKSTLINGSGTQGENDCVQVRAADTPLRTITGSQTLTVGTAGIQVLP